MSLKDKAGQLPNSPGVYIMKDGYGNIIYIGKAKSLKNRVSQYFQSSKRHAPKIVKMIELIREFDYLHADTELEALLLECRLIKDISPMFNSQLKNHRKYIYLWIDTASSYPTIEIVEDKQEKGVCFGPYTSLKSVERALNVLKDNIKLRHCKCFVSKKTGCLSSQLGYCIAPCTGKVSETDYGQLIDKTMKLLEGKDASLHNQLEQQMLTAAEVLDFDKAAKYRDDIRAMKHLINKQRAMQFAAVGKRLIALEKMNDRGYKLFVIKGSNILYKESLDILSDKAALKQHILNIIAAQRLLLLKTAAVELDKAEIDQAQILYSYLKNKKECRYIAAPKSWLEEKTSNKLEQGVDKLLEIIDP